MTSKSKILVVDDNPVNLLFYKELLQADYHLATAERGVQALQEVSRFQPDIIFLDIMMPAMDGYEVCRRIRQNLNTRSVKIILVSAKARTGDRLLGYEAGADDYITKPFNRDELIAKLKVYLKLKSSEELDRLKTEVISLLNHETRTPLAGVISPLQLLIQENTTMSPEERLEWLVIMDESAKKLQDSIERVLLLSAIRANQFVLQPEPANLSSTLQDALEAVADLAHDKGIGFNQRISIKTRISADHPRISEVIRYILENAIKFSPDNTCIDINLTLENPWLTLTIRDYGHGIQPDYLPFVFDLFNSPDIKHPSSGQGISLHLARHIVEMHGGNILLESQPDQGTLVRVQLPAFADNDSVGDNRSDQHRTVCATENMTLTGCA